MDFLESRHNYFYSQTGCSFENNLANFQSVTFVFWLDVGAKQVVTCSSSVIKADNNIFQGALISIDPIKGELNAKTNLFLFESIGIVD